MWERKKPDPPRNLGSQPRNLPLNNSPNSTLSAREEANKDNKGMIRPPGAKIDPPTSWVAPGLQVKGEISGNDDLLIDGSVEGLIQLDDRNVTIGTTASVAADIIAGEVVIYGKVKGNVRAGSRLEIKKEGSVIGDLTTPQILIEDGAHFKGSIEIEKRIEKDTDNSVLPPAA